MKDLIRRAAQDLSDCRNAVVLTGAGISIESGIPPFRGKGGLWEKFDPMEFATIDAFMANPEKVWRIMISEMKGIVDTAVPNDAHRGVAALETMGIVQTVITQNVDGLHQRAGSRDVIEFHGNFAWQRCLDCSERVETLRIDLATIPPRCRCGGIYRPECVFFGEMIPTHELLRSQSVSGACDVMLVIGTSAVVQPAALMPIIAKESGARVIEMNPEPTPLTGRWSDYLIPGGAGDIMRALLEELGHPL